MDRTEKSFDVQECDKSGSTNEFAPDGRGMGKEDRKQQVLVLLNESDLALTPYVIYRNLRMRGSTFERRTLTNYLNELVDEHRVQKIESNGDPLYQITDEGRRSVKEKNNWSS